MSFALALAGLLVGEKVYVQYIEFGLAVLYHLSDVTGNHSTEIPHQD